MTDAEIRARLDAAAAAAATPGNRVAVTDADVADVRRRAEGYDGYTFDRSIGDYAGQYQQRSAPTGHRAFDSQSGFYDTRTHQLNDQGRRALAMPAATRPRTLGQLLGMGPQVPATALGYQPVNPMGTMGTLLGMRRRPRRV